jgi:hypothetical protein
MSVTLDMCSEIFESRSLRTDTQQTHTAIAFCRKCRPTASVFHEKKKKIGCRVSGLRCRRTAAPVRPLNAGPPRVQLHRGEGVTGQRGTRASLTVQFARSHGRKQSIRGANRMMRFSRCRKFVWRRSVYAHQKTRVEKWGLQQCYFLVHACNT